MTKSKPKRTSDTVVVQGLDEFRRELKKLEDAGATELLKDANFKVATFVIEKARSRASSVGRMQSRAASTLKAGKNASRATITGGVGIPYFFGAEFGAKPNILRRQRRPAGWAGPGRWLGYNQFKPWNAPGQGKTGYFLYPTMRDETKAIVEFYGDELDRIAEQAFPD